MMKRKHIGKAFLAALLAASVLTGCSAKTETPSGNSGSAEQSSSASVSDTPSGTSSALESSKPQSSIPESSKPQSSAPESSKPENSAPESSKPESSTPESKPESSVPESSKPQSSVPESSKPQSSVPESSKPQSSSPESSTPEVPPVTTGDTPFGKHGSLSVNGAYLTDSHGQKMQLRGMSTHGIAWFPQFVNYETFKYLRDDWNTNCIRLAMYTGENNGYCSGGNKTEIKKLVTDGVEAATSLGMYVIIDWHILSDNNPLQNKDEAKKFFDEMSKRYAGNGNVVYEICNEPNGGTSWNDVAKYANEIIPVIRANSPDSVIIVGTPTWSQDIDKAAAAPLTFKNVMYSLHFYAATHTDWLRQRMEDCIKRGLPVFISEFGTCDASGNGAVDEWQTEQWLKLVEKYNVSYMCWNLANKNESSSILKENCNKLSGWTDNDLNRQGIIMRDWFRNDTTDS